MTDKPETEVASEASGESMSAEIKDNNPGFPDLESLVLAHAHEIGKCDKKPFEVRSGIFRRYVFAESARQAKVIAKVEARACTNDAVTAALIANLPKSKVE